MRPPESRRGRLGCTLGTLILPASGRGHSCNSNVRLLLRLTMVKVPLVPSDDLLLWDRVGQLPRLGPDWFPPNLRRRASDGSFRQDTSWRHCCLLSYPHTGPCDRVRPLLLTDVACKVVKRAHGRGKPFRVWLSPVISS